MIVIALLMVIRAEFDASACTGFFIKTKDGAVIRGRSLEFGVDLESRIVVIPRGRHYTGTTSTGTDGLSWKTQHGFVGASLFDLDQVLDGVNEKGLYVGLFYFPGYAKYQEVSADATGKILAPWEVGTWLLGNFATVAEARAGIATVKVANVVFPKWGFVLPLHYIVQDAAGNCIVIEYVDGKLYIHDNPIGVITNSPPFDWHITNLCNYINLSPVNVPPIKLSGTQLKGLGQGSGLLGLPGDYTPPSRFVRAVAFSQSATQQETAEQGVTMALHIINTFDIFDGIVVDKKPGEKPSYDITQWITISDLKNKRVYFRTYDDLNIRYVDFRKLDFTAGKMKFIPMEGRQRFQDVSNTKE